MTLKFNSVLEIVEIHVRAKFYQAMCSGLWVINSALDFGQPLDFDREYLSNGSSYWQAENGVINYDFFHVRWKQFGELWCTNEKITSTFDPWPWNSIWFVRLSMYMFMQSIIKLTAAVH